MEVKGNITHGDVVDMSFFSQKYFSYDANDAIVLVRSDLLYLVKSLQIIRKHQYDKSEPLDFDRSSTGTPEIIVVEDDEESGEVEIGGIPISRPQLAQKKVAETKNAKKTKKKITKEIAQKERVSVGSLRDEGRRIAGEKKVNDAQRLEAVSSKLKLGKRDGQDRLIARVAPPLTRVRGGATPSIRAYKDAPFRRTLFRMTSLFK